MAGLNLSPMATSALGDAVASAPGLALQQQQEQAKTSVMNNKATTSNMEVGGEQAYSKLMADQMKDYQPSDDQFANLDAQIKARQQTIPQLAGLNFGQKSQDVQKEVQDLQQQRMGMGFTQLGKAAQAGDMNRMLDIGHKSGILPPNVAKIELDPEGENFIGRDADGKIVTGMSREAAEHMGYTNAELATMEEKKFMAKTIYNRGVDVANINKDAREDVATTNKESKLEAIPLNMTGAQQIANIRGGYMLRAAEIKANAEEKRATSGNPNNVPFEASKIPPGVHGEEAYQYIPENRRDYIRSVVEGRRSAPNGFVMRSPWGAGITQEIAQVDPQFSENRAQIRKAFTTGKDATNRAALNTAALHSDAYAMAMQAMENGEFVPGNALYNQVSTALGHPAPTTAAAIRAASSGEKASALKGNATDQEIKHILDTMKEGASPAQSIAGEKAFLGIAHQKLQTYQDRYNEQLPDDSTWNAVLPSAKKVFDKYGFGQMERPQQQQPAQGGLPKNTDTDLYHVVAGKNIHQHYDPAKGWTEEIMK